ncbi:hypothetical protein JCM12141A_46700 [Mycolicibacterium hodleri]
MNGHLWEVIAVGVMFGLLFVPRPTRRILVSTFLHPRSRSLILREPIEGTGTVLDGEITTAA